jgi:hypothetical protein
MTVINLQNMVRSLLRGWDGKDAAQLIGRIRSIVSRSRLTGWKPGFGIAPGTSTLAKASLCPQPAEVAHLALRAPLSMPAVP